MTLGAGDVTDDADRTADNWSDKERLPTGGDRPAGAGSAPSVFDVAVETGA